MEINLNIILAILVLSIIIIVHEFGHFILAKANGVMVLEFCIGFGPKLISFEKGETVYSIKLLPFGGACMMLGEDFADNSEDTGNESEEAQQQTKGAGLSKTGQAGSDAVYNAEKGIKEQYDMTRSFGAKSVWARISILAAGPVFNFILAFILAVVIIGYIGYDPCKVSVVEDNSPASAAGLMAGDIITGINGRSVAFSKDLTLETFMHPDRKMDITYRRGDSEYTTSVTPEYRKDVSYKTGITILSDCSINAVEDNSPAAQGGMKVKDKIISINGIKQDNTDMLVKTIADCEGKTLSIVVERDGSEVTLNVTPVIRETESYYTGLYSYGERVKVNAISTIGYAFKEVGYWIRYVFGSLGMMFSGRVSLDDVSGPVGVVNIIGEVVEESRSDGLLYVFLNLFNMTVMISANLGVMNLLPLPALDGGRLIFIFIELLRGKPISKEKEGMVHFVGIVLLMILMVIVMFNDIRKIF